MRRVSGAVLVLVGLAGHVSAADGSAYPIAGLTPSQRPAGAPVVSVPQHPADWNERFYRGVTKPYPPSIQFQAVHGGWYTPFDRPGMHPPYDPRNWHNEKKGQ